MQQNQLMICKDNAIKKHLINHVASYTVVSVYLSFEDVQEANTNAAICSWVELQFDMCLATYYKYTTYQNINVLLNVYRSASHYKV